MKKMFAVLVLIVLFVQAMPVQAKGAPISVQVAAAPQEGYVGDTVMVEISIAATRNSKADITIDFPLASVTGVREISGQLSGTQNGDLLRFVYQNLVKKGTTTLQFEVVLGQTPGTRQLVAVSDTSTGWMLTGSFIYLMAQPPLQILTVGPTLPMTTGGQPFTVTITIFNPSATIPQSYDLGIEIFMVGTDRNTFPVLTGGEFGVVLGNSYSLRAYWKGTVASGDTHEIVINMGTGPYPGTWPLIVVKDNFTGRLISSNTIILVAP